MDYFQKLHDDLIEQFKDKPNTKILQKALARQLEELYVFFYELRIMRWLQTAVGAQLDGIGDIVALSRTDALIWSNLAGINVPMNDELYRKYLWFKVFLNTSRGTYGDIVRALKMFWDGDPIYYSEYVEIPATMFFITPTLPFDTDFRVLQVVTRVKAAGVALRLVVPMEPEDDIGMYSAAGMSQMVRQFIICDQTEMQTDITSYSAIGAISTVKEDYTE